MVFIKKPDRSTKRWLKSLPIVKVTARFTYLAQMFSGNLVRVKSDDLK